MARITVEDCIEKVENRFELITLAAARSKQIIKQKVSLVDNYKNRPIVLSLREIAAGRVWPKAD
ncbi:MAG: DNA-directed RNA polymerase subunit omega [Desulfovibrio sp. S3730MH75]|nr:MAG: DNA-directed RNA polymerase subunit omega [Desulfovibrio sp. S3730MH75]